MDLSEQDTNRGYKVACTYLITGGQWQPQGDNPRGFFMEDYNQRLEIKKEYIVVDAVTLSRALQFIDSLDRVVRDTLETS